MTTRISSTSPKRISNTARIRARAFARGCGSARSIHRCRSRIARRGWETPYTHHAFGDQHLDRRGDPHRSASKGRSTGSARASGTRSTCSSPAALFGWNDPAGTMLAQHGFAFDDRQTTLFGRVGAARRRRHAEERAVPRDRSSRRASTSGAQVRYLDRAVLNVLHYDNRADPTAYAPSLRRLRVGDEVRRRGAASGDSARLDGARSVARWRHRASRRAASCSSGSSSRVPRCWRRAWAAHARRALRRFRSALPAASRRPGQRGRACLDDGVLVRTGRHTGASCWSGCVCAAMCWPGRAARRTGARHRKQSRAVGSLRFERHAFSAETSQ